MLTLLVIRAWAGIHCRRSRIGERDPGREGVPRPSGLAAHCPSRTAAATQPPSKPEQGGACARRSFRGERWIAAFRRITTSRSGDEGRRQLIVYRAFFEPGVSGWPDHTCPGCSLVADQVAHVAHLNARDTTLAFASRAPQPDIERVKTRMGWTMPWYTMTDEFDADFGVDEWHGTNAFIRDGDRVFRTYFINNRGDEVMGSTWSYLDLTALGRQEDWEDSPEGYPQTPPYAWWNWHDEYGVTRPGDNPSYRAEQEAES